MELSTGAASAAVVDTSTSTESWFPAVPARFLPAAPRSLAATPWPKAPITYTFSNWGNAMAVPSVGGPAFASGSGSWKQLAFLTKGLAPRQDDSCCAASDKAAECATPPAGAIAGTPVLVSIAAVC